MHLIDTALQLLSLASAGFDAEQYAIWSHDSGESRRRIADTKKVLANVAPEAFWPSEGGGAAASESDPQPV